MSLELRPLTLAQANALVAALHRHHNPVRGTASVSELLTVTRMSGPQSWGGLLHAQWTKTTFVRCLASSPTERRTRVRFSTRRRPVQLKRWATRGFKPTFWIASPAHH